MVTKKQLAALAYGRAVRKANLRRQRKTTNGKYRCKRSKRKTKAPFNDVMNELDHGTGQTETINVDGMPVDIDIENIVPREEKKSFWQKYGKYIAGAAGAALLGKMGYDTYMNSPYKNAKNIIREMANNMENKDYRVDTNKLQQSLNILREDLNKYDFDKEWTPNGVFGLIRTFDNFKDEYKPDKSDKWRTKQKNNLLEILNKYEDVKKSYSLKPK